MNVATFYRFVRIDDPDAARGAPAQRSPAISIFAARSCSRTKASMRRWPEHRRCAEFVFVARSAADARFAALPRAHSRGDADNPVFFRMKVRRSAELIAMHCDDVDPAQRTGVHVDAATWNRLLDDPDVTVIDARNGYEIELGTFPGAIDPRHRSFREFPRSPTQLDPARHKRVAMFCTGGIRCEKASAYLLERGFEARVSARRRHPRAISISAATIRRRQPFRRRVFRVRSTRFGRGRPEPGTLRIVSCVPACADAKPRRASPDYVVDVSCPYCIGRADADRQRAAFAGARTPGATRRGARRTARGCGHGGAKRRQRTAGEAAMDMFSLKGKVAALSGASTGIGRHLAGTLAAPARRCVLGARSVAKLDERVAEIRAAGGERICRAARRFAIARQRRRVFRRSGKTLRRRSTFSSTTRASKRVRIRT